MQATGTSASTPVIRIVTTSTSDVLTSTPLIVADMRGTALADVATTTDVVTTSVLSVHTTTECVTAGIVETIAQAVISALPT